MTAAGNHLRVTARMLLMGVVTLENVFDVRVESWTSGSDLQVSNDMATWVDGAYGEMLGEFSNLLTFVDVATFNVSTKSPYPTVPWPSLTIGTNSADVLATGVAALALFHTVKSKCIGRKFIGGLTENALNAALLTSSVLGHLEDFAIHISSGPAAVESTASYEFVIYDKLAAPQIVVRTVVNAIPGYQRRRRQGVGV